MMNWMEINLQTLEKLIVAKLQSVSAVMGAKVAPTKY